MTRSHSLYVSTKGLPVGTIHFQSREERFGFAYDPAWLRAASPFYLSPRMPLDETAADAGVVQRFIQNLLPEGRALEIASIFNQVSKDNTFSLIRLLGEEPVGALSFLGMDATPEEAEQIARRLHSEGDRRAITHEELSERIRSRDAVPFPIWDGKPRLSLAGFQDKLQVLVEGASLSLAEGRLCSTHLLKPESRNPNTQHMVANEHFCMRLAAAMGLPVAPVEIRRVPDPILLIERFDRRVRWAPDARATALAVERLHVIDACQALDFPSTFKYERNVGGNDAKNIREGVSFERLFSLMNDMTTPALARPFVLRWAILQLLIGNSDAHGKNVSFTVDSGGMMPAPMYDLVSVNVYGHSVETDMAMGYGDAFNMHEIGPFQLADFAVRTGTPPAQLAREMTNLSKAVLRLAPEVAESTEYTEEERAFVQRIVSFVCAQAHKLIKLAPQIKKVDSRLL